MGIDNKIPSRINLDKHPKFLDGSEAFYLLNHERNREGYGGASTPMNANYPFGELVQPSGENYRIGSFKSEITNEVYAWIFNSEGVHYIQRISDTNGLEIVYQGPCLQLSAEPKHAIEQWRATLRLETVYDNRDGIGCKNRHGKYLVWTDGVNPIGHIDVEASIATNSFTTPFFDECSDDCALIQLCVPEPCEVLTGEYVPRSNVNDGFSNKILDIGFKFIYRYITYDERASEWSTPSTLYYQSTDGCFDSAESMPRCIKLRIPIGNPQVERIEVAFNKGDRSTEGNDDIYLSYEVIDKYKKYNSTQQYWYERQLSETVLGNNFSEEDCSFDYLFCNDKNCNPVSTPRTYNPTPITPQGVLVIKDKIGFYNFVQGNCPIDKFETDKFKINVACTDDSDCERQLVEIKVRAVIYQNFYGTIEYVYRMGGAYGDTKDDVSDPAYYGGNSGDVFDNADDGLGQPFHLQDFNRARNFTAFIEGTSYFVEMKQWRANDLFTNAEEYGILAGFAHTANDLGTLSNKDVIKWARGLSTGAFFFQEATFKVPKGMRGVIRIRSNNSRLNNGDTSARVVGTAPLTSLTTNGTYFSNITTILSPYKYEIPFDTCGVDSLDIKEAFVIQSESYAGRFVYAFSGYIRDIDNKPIEGLQLKGGRDNAVLSVTDHNGYYYFSYDKFSATADAITIDILGETSCENFTSLKTLGFIGQLNVDTITDIQINASTYERFIHTVRVNVKDCNGNPVGGVRVAMTGTKYQVTNQSTGVATFKLRNYSTRDRSVRGYVMDSKGCFNYDCNGDCGVCTPQTSLFSLGACFISSPLSEILTDAINVAKLTSQLRGLKKNGRYPFGYVVKGDCGRISAVNELPYVDIPSAQTTGLSGFCSLSYDATGIELPAWGKCIEIVRGENLNNYVLQWVVDSFEKTSDNKIKITLQSLIDYNILYGARTNTKYQWLAGDRVEFIRDDKGVVIDPTTKGTLNYLILSPFNDTDLSGVTTTDVNFFNQILIEDDGKIDFLKAGAVIELQRPKECTVEPIYFSIGVSLPVENGRLLNEIGTFETFDTYQQRRVINSGALITFEHHSPSDFWGDRLSDVGKVYFANKYENERRFGQSITLNSSGQYNYFGETVKTFDGLSSDIVSMNIKDGKIIMIICQTDNALAQASDDLIRVGTDGVIRAAAPDAVISDGEPKLYGEYGCQYDDIGSIYYGDGFAEWLDTRFYEKISNDYRSAKSISFGKANTYFRKVGINASMVNKTATNPLDKIRFCSGQNMQTRAIQLTTKSLRHAGINNDFKLYQSPNSTILSDNESEDFLTFASWTPEGYSSLILNDGFGCAMITYQNGMPYIHPMVPEKFNEFYGVGCDRVVGVSINGDGKIPQKIKVPVSFELQSDQMYFVANVETSDANFSSEIPAKRIKHNENKWNASFLKNKNSRGGLYEGQVARDYYINVTLCRDNTDDLKYGTIDNQKRIKFDVLSMIILKFNFSEQSGFAPQQ